MPRRNDIIGQACEFDYLGTQAGKALRKLGYEIVLVNSNPATIMTDPGMADRIIGEVTMERVGIVRGATKIVEEELCETGAFQYLAILHEDRVTGVREGQRDFGFQIEVRCWDSKDAIAGAPTKLPYEVLDT